jgi:hypothetical protein
MSAPATSDEIDDDNNNVGAIIQPQWRHSRRPVQLDLPKLIGEVDFDGTITIDGR